MVIPMAIIYEIAFFVSITLHTLSHEISAIKKFCENLYVRIETFQSTLEILTYRFSRNFFIAEIGSNKKPVF